MKHIREFEYIFKHDEAISYKELWPHVKEECRAIASYFSKDEITNVIQEIEKGKMNPYSVIKCIYGILTGNCNNEKANKFISEHVKSIVVTSYRPTTLRVLSYLTVLEYYIMPNTLESNYKEKQLKRIQQVKKWLK